MCTAPESSQPVWYQLPTGWAAGGHRAACGVRVVCCRSSLGARAKNTLCSAAQCKRHVKGARVQPTCLVSAPHRLGRERAAGGVQETGNSRWGETGATQPSPRLFASLTPNCKIMAGSYELKLGSIIGQKISTRLQFTARRNTQWIAQKKVCRT